MVWEDDRTSSYNIYAQKINSTGYIEWDDNGTAISTASGSQTDPRICGDGLGGAYIVWRDGRGSSYDIYAQYINSSGVTQWGNGTLICNEVET